MKAGRANNTEKKLKWFFIHFIFIKHSNKIRLFMFIFIVFIFRHTSNQIIIYFFIYLNEHS